MRSLKDMVLFSSIYLGAVSYGSIYLMTLFSKSIGGNETDVGGFLILSGVATLIITGGIGRITSYIGSDKICTMGCLLIGLSFLALTFLDKIGTTYYICGFFVGLGWSIFYATGPMIVINCVESKEKGRYISLISACIVSGTATLPIIMSFSSFININISIIFFISAISSFISSALCLFLGKMFKINKEYIVESSYIPIKKALSILGILRTDARYSFIMVLLGACIFSSLMNFQTSFAETKGLNFSIFYGFYMISVIGCRVLFGGVLAARNPISPTPVLLMLMFIGLFLMLINSGSAVIYALSAICLGISYGLVYPLIKTFAIKSVPEKDTNNVISYFTFFYFVGVYFFPFIGGYIISKYNYNGIIYLLLLICASDIIVGVFGRTSSQKTLTSDIPLSSAASS